MDWQALIADGGLLLSGISAAVGSLTTLLIAKSNNKKELSMNDRVQLSKDQYQLIAELRGMIQEQRDENIEFRELVEVQKQKLEALIIEMNKLQLANLNLTLENEKLKEEVRKLTELLTSFNKGEK